MAPTASASRPILWDIYEEHLDEAGWLWGQWEQALDSALYAISDVAIGPEERLAAHLDGLVLGGAPVAKKLLLPALTHDDSGMVSAAAWALLQAEDVDHQDAVVGALAAAEPPGRRAIARALSLSLNPDISRVARLWSSGPVELRPFILESFGLREPDWVAAQLPQALSSSDSFLQIAALQASRLAPERALLAQVEDAIRSANPAVRYAAIPTGVMLGSRTAWEAARRAVTGAEPVPSVLFGLLASSDHAADREGIRRQLDVPSSRSQTLWALGFSGELQDVDLLIEAMADPEVAAVAGEAFSTITGLPLVGTLVVPGETKGPGEEEVGLDDPPPVVHSEDHLPIPDAPAVGKWWHRRRGQLKEGVRYLGGAPRTDDSVRAALSTAATWRREVLWLSLAVAGRAPERLDVRDWATRQQRVLGG